VTNPLTSRVVVGTASLITLGLIALAVVNYVSRPLGVISFVHPKTRALLHEEYLGRPLRGWRRTYVSRGKALESLNLGKFTVTKADADPMTETRAITLQLYDQDKQLISEQVIESGGAMYFYDPDHDEDVKIEYQ
jgi:hypothetical protein